MSASPPPSPTSSPPLPDARSTSVRPTAVLETSLPGISRSDRILGLPRQKFADDLGWMKFWTARGTGCRPGPRFALRFARNGAKPPCWKSHLCVICYVTNRVIPRPTPAGRPGGDAEARGPQPVAVSMGRSILHRGMTQVVTRRWSFW